MRLLVPLIAVALLIAGSAVRAQGVRDEALRRMTPEQREQLWQSMSPQQRAEFWRRLTPEQRQSIRQQSSPEQRDAVRQRFEERQRRAPEPIPPGTAPATPPGAAPGLIEGLQPGVGAGPRRLSPEERQKLREQIQESTRDLRETTPRRGLMERHKNRER